MTRSIEEALNLPPIKEALAKKEAANSSTAEVPEEPVDPEVEQMAQALASVKSTSVFENTGEKEHSKEMNEVISLALEAHKSILDFGFNVEAKHAGTIMAQAANHLDIALKASKSKADFKAKILEMKMEREQYESAHGINSTDAEVISDNSSKGELKSRNDLILQMKEEAKRFASEQKEEMERAEAERQNAADKGTAAPQ